MDVIAASSGWLVSSSSDSALVSVAANGFGEVSPISAGANLNLMFQF